MPKYSLPSGFVTRLETEQHGHHYQTRLAQGLHHFRTWLRHTHAKLDLTRKRRQEVDNILALYVQACHDASVNFSTPKHAVLAVQKMLQLHFKLPRAWGCLRAWKQRIPASHRTPIPLEILQGMFAVALDGYLSGLLSPLLLPLAVLLRVAYFGLLRPGEVQGLRCQDVFVGSTSAFKPVAVVILRSPKNKASMGQNQFATIHEPGTVAWLGWLSCNLGPDAKLWPSSSQTFSALFRLVLANLGLSKLPLTPGCLRPGGATRYFVDGMSLGDLQFAGRWRSPQSLGAYVQEAMAHFVWLNLDQQQRAGISATVLTSACAWSQPPRVPRALFGPTPRGWLRSSRLSRAPP